LTLASAAARIVPQHACAFIRQPAERFASPEGNFLPDPSFLLLILAPHPGKTTRLTGKRAPTLAATKGIRMIRNSYRNKLTRNLSWLRSRAAHCLRRSILCPVAFGLLFALALSLATAAPVHAQKVNERQARQKLSKSYREWLEHDVVYIITRDERSAFLQLASDEARDKFIERFWEVRNPTPGSPSNSYRDDIYRRIAFANSNFGTGSGTDGWRTARGQTYITLGPPQSKQVYRVSANLVGIEIWFYSNPDYAFLPPFFSVMFYQRENFGDYRFYSPYMDGPDKLVSGMETINDRVHSLKLIQDSLGAEVARLSLSLLPGEPVDEQNATATMASDLMLAQIKAMGEQPLYRQMIERRQNMLENVSSRLIVEGHNLDIATLPVRDSRGLTRLDYAIRLHNASDLSVSQESNGNYKYALEVRVRVFGADSKLLFTQQRTVMDSLDKAHMSQIKDKAFGFESSLPLPPGKYRLDFLLTDWTKKVGMHAEREVTVPAVDANTLVVPGIMAFSAAENLASPQGSLVPFSIAGVKFTPLAGTPLVLSPTQTFQVVYQIWTAPQPPQAYAGRKIEIGYALGQPAGGGAKVITEEVGMDQFDSSGSFLSGKKMPIINTAAVGNYMLTVSIKEGQPARQAFATLNFRIFSNIDASAPWDVIDPSLSADADNGITDQQRGLCYFAQGFPDESRAWFRRALDRNHSNDASRTRLVDAYYTRKDYAAVVSMFNDTGVTDETDSETIVRIADSLAKTGDMKKAVSLLESTLHARPEEGPLYLALAECYERMGDSRRAAELAKKGQAYLRSGPAENSTP
jgi:GWxTD domain-containing protein